MIAREWTYLPPVRSSCEARGIPVEAANADLPDVWRLRKTQSPVTWLKGRERAALHVSDLAA